VLKRRVAGLFAALLMSQLVLASSDLVCLQHGGEKGPAAATSLSDRPAHAHHHGGDTRQPDAPDDLPAPSDCCQAMTTCSNFAFRSGDADLPAPAAHTGALTLVASAPLSRIETPDPPPPRA
jgi:hypothetical protein